MLFTVDVISQFVCNCSQIASRINKSMALFVGPFMAEPGASPHYPTGRNAKFHCSFNEEHQEMFLFAVETSLPCETDVREALK